MTNELQSFVIEYESHEPQLENYLPPPPVQQNHVPALIVRWVQLRISRWIDRQLLSSTAIPVPQLTTLFDTIFVGDQWAPVLPSAYWEAAYPHVQQQQQQQQQQQRQQQLPGPGGGHQGGGNLGGGGGNPGGGGGNPGGGGNDSRVTNERFNPVLTI